jgi:UDP-N-acetyl-D-mannosaminuronic acid transferase (WecB/TagA/CpsF family)
MPDAEHREALIEYASLRGIGKHWTYTEAPVYPRSGPITDESLAARIEREKPVHVILGIAGGTQERLGLYLRDHLAIRPSIVCTGAAIAFVTGKQASIPIWADRLMLGWLFRCFREPKKFIPRYWKAQRLLWVLLRHRARSPA